MSTYYLTEKTIVLSILRDRLLHDDGVRIHEVEADGSLVLTDGKNYISAYQAGSGRLEFFRQAGNLSGYILGTIERLLDTVIYSEYCPQFWGYDTDEEWDAAQAKMEADHRHKHAGEIRKFVRNEPSGIVPGTVGHAEAQIASRLCEADPTLLLLENEPRLMATIREVYDEQNQNNVTITFSNDELRQIERIAKANELMYLEAKRER